MSTVTARSVRRDITRRGLNPKMIDGFPGKRRGERRPQPLATKRHTEARVPTRKKKAS